MNGKSLLKVLPQILKRETYFTSQVNRQLPWLSGNLKTATFTGVQLSEFQKTALNNQTSMLTDTRLYSTAPAQKGFLSRMARKLGWLDHSRSKLKRSGYVLYEKAMGHIDMQEFFQVCELPDTFYSWFLVMEVHIWMLMVRLMDEGEEGRYVRNCLVEAMWEDVDHRSKKLGASNASARRAQVDQILEQFQATLFHYDEGLMIDDKALAGALWCHLFSKDLNDPERLECVLQYIRKQISMLDGLSREDMLLDCDVKWSSLLERDGQQKPTYNQFDPSVFLR